MIASMLSIEYPVTKWPSFLNKELSSVKQKEGDILPTLKLSYDRLPSHLKHCFAYCSLFPKDRVIDVDTLVDLWIAQGFIGVPSDESLALEDEGYGYFFELFKRSFFQEVKTDEIMNMAVSCKMHDLVHDLAIQVAGERCARSDLGRGGIEKARHVSYSVLVPSLSKLQTKRLRSFLHSSNDRSTFRELTAEKMVSNFKLLRMLDLHASGIETVPNSIGNLKHLRYLDLSGNYKIQTLPTCITKLVNLQTLKLKNCGIRRELPAGINKLVNLKNLQFSNWAGCEPSLLRGVSRLTNLQTISDFKLSEDPALATSELDELKGLNSLRGNLKLRWLRSGVKTEDANLKGKKHLQSLQLAWMRAGEEVEQTLKGLQPHQNLRKLVLSGYNGVRFPNWLSSLTSLVALSFHDNLKCQQLPSLDQLGSLKKLYLSSFTVLECIITDTEGDGNFVTLPAPVPVFRSLEELKLKDLPNFRGWQSPNIRENAHPALEFPSYFPRLTWLAIELCPKLTSMPLYPNVKEFKLRNSNTKPFEKTVSISIPQPQISASATTTIDQSSSSSAFYPFFCVRSLRLLTHRTTDLPHLPDWMQNLSNLKTLQISKPDRSRLESRYMMFNTVTGELDIDEDDECEIPNKGNLAWKTLARIRQLVLIRVSTLKHLSPSFRYITSLEKLHIKSCEEIKFASDGNDTVKWEALTSLRALVFDKLPKLVALPEELQRIATLQDLRISDCDNLAVIPGWICNLSSLQTLEIKSCSKIESLPGSMSRLASLQMLEIRSCPVFSLERCDGSDDEYRIEWEALTSLHNLVLCLLPKLVTLPEGLQHATTLQYLELMDCCNLIALPDWISKLASLQELVIWRCPMIESLPGSIRSLASLRHLRISHCLVLSQKCQRQTGEDWPKIRHISDIVID